MKRAPRASGFTIVETMIVLAVTGVLFLAVAASISGRQNRYRYLTDSQDIRNRLQQMLNDVQNGYFPQVANFSCQRASGSLSFSTVSVQQGKNSDCIFLGKAMQFGVGSANADPETVNIASIAGLNQTGAATEVSPTVAPALTASFVLGADLQTKSISVNGIGGTYDGVAFLSDAGSVGSGGQLLSGQQPIHAYAIKSPSLHETSSFGASNSPTNPNPGVSLSGTHSLVEAHGSGIQVCFKSLGTNNYALITIGANGSATDIALSTHGSSC